MVKSLFVGWTVNGGSRIDREIMNGVFGIALSM